MTSKETKWLTERLREIDRNVKAPKSLVLKIQKEIKKAK